MYLNPEQFHISGSFVLISCRSSQHVALELKFYFDHILQVEIVLAAKRKVQKVTLDLLQLLL